MITELFLINNEAYFFAVLHHNRRWVAQVTKNINRTSYTTDPDAAEDGIAQMYQRGSSSAVHARFKLSGRIETRTASNTTRERERERDKCTQLW